MSGAIIDGVRPAPATSSAPVTPRLRRRPLITRAWRVPAMFTIVAAIACFATLASAVHGLDRATGFDTRVLRWLYFHLGPSAAQVSLDAVSEAVIIAGIAFGAIGCALWRRFDAALLVVATPLACVSLTEFVLKPLIARRFGAGDPGASLDEISPYAFPSGHTAALSGLTVSLALVVLRAPIGRGLRAAGIALLAVWTAVGAVGLIRNNYHYATDTIGSLLLTVACTLTFALVIDAVRSQLIRRS